MNTYIEYLDKTIEELQKEEALLIGANRKDEANFVKIKGNICDICKTVYKVHAGTKSGDELKNQHLAQLSKFRETWSAALALARTHDDAEKIIVEETKLDMLQVIMAKFEELGACD